MNVVILAGGYGTRLSEATVDKPKPMVEIGHRPILWHVMSIFARFGHDEFFVACGYKGDIIKQYFATYPYQGGDLTICLKSGVAKMTQRNDVDWTVHAIDTGRDTNTGGRLRHLRDRLGNKAFLCTYGDGLCSVDIGKLIEFHKSHGRLATVTAVHPPARFGALELSGTDVTRFSEKPQTERDWINGGFFVFEPGIFDFIDGADSSLEKDVLERVAAAGQLAAFCHPGFFQPMDTLRERQILEEHWQSGVPPWRTST